MTARVVLTCSCGASVDGAWEADDRRIRDDLTPPQLEQFRRDHMRCRDLSATKDSPPVGDAESPQTTGGVS